MTTILPRHMLAVYLADSLTATFGKFSRPLEECEVSAIGWISDCQSGGPGFNPRPGRGLNFGRPSFATLPVDRDVNPLVQWISRRSTGGLFK